MIASKYENTYKSVQTARKNSDIIDDVVTIIKAHSEDMTSAEIATLLWGARDYHHNIRHYAARMGQAMKHLRQNGFVESRKIDGEPVEIHYQDWIPNPDNLKKIKVHDDAGNEYIIQNPKYDRYGGYGHWGMVTKMVTPKIKVWHWIGD